jgi:hypothetical protein
MLHYELDTGERRVCSGFRIDEDVVMAVARYARPGDHGFGPYRLAVPEISGELIAVLSRAGEALMTMGVSGSEEDADVVWPAMAELATVDDPRPPAVLPWVATVTGGIPEERDGLTKFALHLAWAWLSRRPHVASECPAP